MSARSQYSTWATKKAGATKSSWRHWKRTLKKSINKLWRRQAKQNPEEAPVKRPTRGYSD